MNLNNDIDDGDRDDDHDNLRLNDSLISKIFLTSKSMKHKEHEIQRAWNIIKTLFSFFIVAVISGTCILYQTAENDENILHVR